MANRPDPVLLKQSRCYGNHSNTDQACKLCVIQSSCKDVVKERKMPVTKKVKKSEEPVKEQTAPAAKEDTAAPEPVTASEKKPVKKVAKPASKKKVPVKKVAKPAPKPKAQKTVKKATKPEPKPKKAPKEPHVPQKRGRKPFDPALVQKASWISRSRPSEQPELVRGEKLLGKMLNQEFGFTMSLKESTNVPRWFALLGGPVSGLELRGSIKGLVLSHKSKAIWTGDPEEIVPAVKKFIKEHPDAARQRIHKYEP